MGGIAGRMGMMVELLDISESQERALYNFTSYRENLTASLKRTRESSLHFLPHYKCPNAEIVESGARTKKESKVVKDFHKSGEEMETLDRFARDHELFKTISKSLTKTIKKLKVKKKGPNRKPKQENEGSKDRKKKQKTQKASKGKGGRKPQSKRRQNKRKGTRNGRNKLVKH